MNDDTVQYVNGEPHYVAVTKGKLGWQVELRNKRNATLRTSDGEYETSAPTPGNRMKTEAVAKRLAKAHGVPVLRMETGKPHEVL